MSGRDDTEPRSPTPDPGDVAGRRESLTEGAEDMAYGEPKGPRPPHIERLPKEEIERRAAGGADRTHPRSRTAPDRDRDGYYGGVETAEATETTGDEQSKVVHDPVPGPGAAGPER